jgi:nicotinate-nucleotide pyrophosphorylase (carboxylating)
MPNTDSSLPESLPADVRRALDEDLGTGDVTASLIPGDGRAEARVVCREPAVICGAPWFDAVFAALDSAIRVDWEVAEGARCGADEVVCRLSGPARPMLTGERTALNFLQTLSGTATVTRAYADAVAGTGCRILDTRKTIPGLRAAQKYATRVGGAVNHRQGLWDALLIKENHLMAAGGISEAVAAARRLHPGLKIEVEVENLEEAREALAVHADILLLDNFSLGDLREAAHLARGTGSSLEASGDVTLETLADVAATGVDFVSIGALTKHLRAVDFSMRFDSI